MYEIPMLYDCDIIEAFKKAFYKDSSDFKTFNLYYDAKTLDINVLLNMYILVNICSKLRNHIVYP